MLLVTTYLTFFQAKEHYREETAPLSSVLTDWNERSYMCHVHMLILNRYEWCEDTGEREEQRQLLQFKVFTIVHICSCALHVASLHFTLHASPEYKSKINLGVFTVLTPTVSRVSGLLDFNARNNAYCECVCINISVSKYVVFSQ